VLEPWGRQGARREIVSGVTSPAHRSRCLREHISMAARRGVVRVHGPLPNPVGGSIGHGQAEEADTRRQTRRRENVCVVICPADVL
jgi:hypothetical protein